MPSAQKRPTTNNFGRRPLAANMVPISRLAYRHGQLITNSGFEDTAAFIGWHLYPGVDLITAYEYAVHSGLAAARLGHILPQAQLVQLVKGVIPGKYYQLSFFLMAVHDSDNAPVSVTIDYLNNNKKPVGKTALQIKVEQFCLSDEVYTGFIDYTHCPVPDKAHYAQVMIEIDTTKYPQGAVLLDDITMVGIV